MVTIKKLKELELEVFVSTIWRELRRQGFTFGRIKDDIRIKELADIRIKERADIQAWRAR